MQQKAPIGIDDFKELIEQAFLYVDKTLLIEEVWETAAKVQLITRPRRFGKTINMSMLRYFFDARIENGGALFRGLAIEKRPCFVLQGKFPVIALTFKDLKAKDFDEFLSMFAEMISDLFRKCNYLYSGLDETEQRRFGEILDEKAPSSKLKGSLAFLMQLLEKYHGTKVILLLDEYDSPIHEGYANDYYQDVVELMRSFLGKALKGNTSLEKAVVTGILRVAKESIFSDLNNLKVFTLLDDFFSDKFGFTTPEVKSLLERVGWQNRLTDVERWYNGYLAGNTVLYNPWSILNYLDDQKQVFKAYWVNTSANLLIREQLLNAHPDVHDQLERLMQGQTVETLIQQHTVFRDLTANTNALWSFFLYGGYLKVAGKIQRGHEYYYQLAIPNLEVQLLFKNIILEWLNRSYGQSSLQNLLNSLIEGKFEDFQTLLAELALSVLSYYDTDKLHSERVYHAFVLGLVVNLSDRYEIRSNREAGLGRYDLMLRPRDPSDRGIIMEFKAAKTPETIEAALEAAEKQMQQKAYGTELEAADVRLRSEIAVAFCGKQVAIRGRTISGAP